MTIPKHTEYETATGDLAKAQAALSIARRKSNPDAAWDWAVTAANHAAAAGVANPRAGLGEDTYPDLRKLDAALRQVRTSEIIIVTRHKGFVEWLAHQGITLIVTAEVGPRIIYCSLHDRGNLFYVNQEQAGSRGGDEWKTYGGHRLWCAPEEKEFTYAPDNQPVTVNETADSVRFIAPEEKSGVLKTIVLLPLEGKNGFNIEHIIRNMSHATLHLAPWALTVMRTGGTAALPGDELDVFLENLGASVELGMSSANASASMRWRKPASQRSTTSSTAWKVMPCRDGLDTTRIPAVPIAGPFSSATDMGFPPSYVLRMTPPAPTTKAGPRSSPPDAGR